MREVWKSGTGGVFWQGGVWRADLMTHLRVAVRSYDSVVKSLSCLCSSLSLASGACSCKHCFVPSRATVVIVIMLPQQCGALKRRAITLVEDLKFHTRTVGGNRTWGGFGQGANWGGDAPPVCVPRRAFIQIADAGCEALADCFPRARGCWEKPIWMGP